MLLVTQIWASTATTWSRIQIDESSFIFLRDSYNFVNLMEILIDLDMSNDINKFD